ncbi:MAG: hypothetical protein R3C16_10860 [Hyphomonadaceae bacterium]
MWPADVTRANAQLTITDVVEGLNETPKEKLPEVVAGWLDRLDENGRWALLKLITGALRIGVSARLARTALAQLGGQERRRDRMSGTPMRRPIRICSHGSRPARRQRADCRARFYPPMLSHPIEPDALAGLDPTDFCASGSGMAFACKPRRARTLAVRAWRGSIRALARTPRARFPI